MREGPGLNPGGLARDNADIDSDERHGHCGRSEGLRGGGKPGLALKSDVAVLFP